MITSAVVNSGMSRIVNLTSTKLSRSFVHCLSAASKRNVQSQLPTMCQQCHRMQEPIEFEIPTEWLPEPRNWRITCLSYREHQDSQGLPFHRQPSSSENRKRFSARHSIAAHLFGLLQLARLDHIVLLTLQLFTIFGTGIPNIDNRLPHMRTHMYFDQY